MFVLAHYRPQQYGMLLQEDRFVEWLTVGLFAAAGIAQLTRAVPQRRIFDILVAAFCVFVAGEEFSWGQRLLGFTPPDVFLEHNVQQEFTLHNFADVFGKPKGILTLALLGYGLVLPLVALTKRGAHLLERAGATPPPPTAIPWLLTAAGLLFWYPLDLTGEWVEALAGAMFLVSATSQPRVLALSTAVAAAAAIALATLSARSGGAHPALISCAQRETTALMQDVATTGAATNRLLNPDRSIHKRFYTSVTDGYIDADMLALYYGESCGRSQKYLLDPWGMAYWIRVDDEADSGRRVQVYSMGPNRRRDNGGDDIAASGHTR